VALQSYDVHPGGVVEQVLPLPRIHFLFMLMDALPHGNLWGEFFADAPNNSYRAWAHCVHHHACEENLTMPGLQLVPTVYSARRVDLMTPMVRLLESALQDPVDGYPNPLDKFVLVSDSTLPLKPFASVFSVLTAHASSDMCFFPPEDYLLHADIEGTLLFLPKQHQWVVLNRNHSEMLVNNWVSPCTELCNWTIPYSEGGLNRLDFAPPPNSAKSLDRLGSVYGKVMGRGRSSNCRPGSTATDEYAVFANIFGPLEEFSRASLTDLSVESVCHTWTSFPEMDGKRARINLSDRPGYIDAIQGHPGEIHETDTEALSALRSSPYLFARKFLPNEDYAELHAHS